jgi:dihydrofolate reductase
MGRKTFESIGRPLPKRRNIVISRTNVEVEGIETFSSMKEALESPLFSSSLNGDRWLIGGASIYEEGMQYADEIHLTLTPDIITTSNVVKFPWVSPQQFAVRELRPLEDGSQLMYAIYSKI